MRLCKKREKKEDWKEIENWDAIETMCLIIRRHELSLCSPCDPLPDIVALIDVADVDILKKPFPIHYSCITIPSNSDID